MYPVGYLPSQGVQPQVFGYTFLPGPMVLPPIQMHNFNRQPLATLAGDRARCLDMATQFYSLSSYCPFLYPAWSWGHVNPIPYYFGSGGLYSQSSPGLVGQSQESWSEGSFFWGELRWGRINRVWSSIRELPGFVRDDLLRMYGTYPYTEVSITYTDGVFLVQGKPFVGQQEYRVERRRVQGAPHPTNSETGAEASRSDDEAEESRGNQS